MADSALGVWLGPRRVGTLTSLFEDVIEFRFDEDYLEDPNAPVLGRRFIDAHGETVREIARTQRVAPPFFSNLLPDEGTLLRNVLARQHAIDPGRDFSLLRVLGGDLPGAVVLRTLETADDAEPAAVDPAPSAYAPLCFSLAGVQLKFSVSMVARRVTVPLAGVGGNWIAKLPMNVFPGLPENEFTIMSFAATVGLDVPRIKLVDLDAVDGLPQNLPTLRESEPRKAYVIARFDRLPNGDRVHVEDFNQIADQPPFDKYANRSSAWIAKRIATLCPQEDLDEFVRRLVFGVCVGNNDMHLKNWAVGYPDGRTARIAPLYDYICTLRYFPDGKLAIPIGSERDFECIDRHALRRLAEAADISVHRTLAVAEEMVARIRESWISFRTTVKDRELLAAIEQTFSLVPLMSGR